MEHPYADISDSERLERDWQAEQRAEARFLRETYTYWETDKIADKIADKIPDKIADKCPKQLNLFEVQQ